MLIPRTSLGLLKATVTIVRSMLTYPKDCNEKTKNVGVLNSVGRWKMTTNSINDRALTAIFCRSEIMEIDQSAEHN